MSTSTSERRLAWDGVSFRLPSEWEFSGYLFHRGVTQITLDDSYGRRATIEWMRPTQRLNRDRVGKAYAKREKALVKSSDKRQELTSLSSGWRANLYRREDGECMIIALFLSDAPPLFAFFRFYFGASDREVPQSVMRQIGRSLVIERGPLIPWQVYDVSLQMPAAFRLWLTSLEAGRKMLAFQRRLTRFFYWQFSLADRLLKDASPADFCATFLSRYPLIHGPRFIVDPQGRIQAKRRKYNPLPHFDEIARLSFRYHVGFRLEPETNRLYLWVYNYRVAADLRHLPMHFRG